MKRGSIFETDGIPRIQEALPLALQHVVAMIVGCVTPAIIVAGAAGLENKDQVILIQAALVVAALSTLLQLFPIGKKYRIGSGLPIIMGVSFAYVPSMQAIADGYGIDTILGAQIVGGVVAVIMGIMVKKIRVFFPPLITGTVVFTIGLSLYPTAINYMAGGTSNPDYGSWQNWLVAFFTLAVVCTWDNPPVMIREPQKRSINPICTSALFMATSAATTTASQGVKRIRPMDSPVWSSPS